MKVQQLPIYQFLEGSRKSFIIPVYQRDYAWTKTNCQKLWNDLVDLRNNKRIDHFLGTLVTIGSGFEEYTIIDGQQRLTTISILLIALRMYLKDKNDTSPEDKLLSEQICDFLINKYSKEEDKRIRLKPNKQDKEHFDSLFTNVDKANINSNVVNNFHFFYQQINEQTLSPQELFDSFLKLNIVLIDLVREQDDPQLIFESLNSTGVNLTAGDLIRNYILMDLEPAIQEKMYKNYWVKIEKLTINIAEFMRNYLNFKLKISINRDDVYATFKKFATDVFNKEKEAILKDLLYFSEIYGYLTQNKKHSNPSIDSKLERLNRLEFTVCYPYFLDLFNDAEKNILSHEVVVKILSIIESYAFRKILVDNTTQGLNKMFITLSKEIKKEESWEKQYLNILNFILLNKTVSQRFPDDAEFENALIHKEVYKLQAKNRNFLLVSLENFSSAYIIENIDDLTIEHIMPQKLTPKWKEELGINWENIHKKYKHTLGNLTLTAKNPELSNDDFKNKQEIDFQNSKLRLNFKLENISNWNEERIIERAKNLAENAKEIWKYPESSYSKEGYDEEQSFDLTSQEDFTGSKPSLLSINSIENKIKTWRDLLRSACKFLHDFSPTEFIKLQENPKFQSILSDDRSKLKSPLEFVQHRYIEGHTNANRVVNVLSRICEAINYPAEDILFFVKYDT